MEQFLTPAYWMQLVDRLLRVAVILIGCGLCFRVFRLVIRRFFFTHPASRLVFEEKRAKTLSSLLESICRYAMYFVVTVMVLQEFHIDTTSILASAGVIGLALGVGAQSVVKDFVAGFFIILEDQYSEGEYIVSGPVEGTVEEMGFRVTKLRDASGVLHIVPNGGILRVTNFNRGSVQAAVNLPVPYNSDVKALAGILQQSCEAFRQEHPELVDGPNLLGIVEFQPAYMLVRILMKCVPLTQAKTEAALRYRIRADLQAANMPLPGMQTDAAANGASAPEIFTIKAPSVVSPVETKP